VTALDLQYSRSALDRATDLVVEALQSNPDRSKRAVTALKVKLRER